MPDNTDYLKVLLEMVCSELKIVQPLQPHHCRQLIELNSMISDILTQQMLDRRAYEEALKRADV